MSKKIIKTFEYYTDNEIRGHIEGGEADGQNIQHIAKKHMMTYDELAKQLEVGKKVQVEHTKKPELPEGDESINREISLDHLAENPEYYTELIEAGIVDELEAIKMYIKLYGPIKSEDAIAKYKEKFGDFVNESRILDDAEDIIRNTETYNKLEQGRYKEDEEDDFIDDLYMELGDDVMGDTDWNSTALMIFREEI